MATDLRIDDGQANQPFGEDRGRLPSDDAGFLSARALESSLLVAVYVAQQAGRADIVDAPIPLHQRAVRYRLGDAP